MVEISIALHGKHAPSFDACVVDKSVAMDQEMRFETIGSTTGLGACIALGALLINQRLMLKISITVDISIALKG